MKKAIFFTILIAGIAIGNAQWSNTTNPFYDSLDMPVARAAGDEGNPLVIKSGPNGGYFVVGEGFRTTHGNDDMFAQEYDRNGYSLLATNEVPVATGQATDQQNIPISAMASSITIITQTYPMPPVTATAAFTLPGKFIWQVP